jgi:hypothetical protein
MPKKKEDNNEEPKKKRVYKRKKKDNLDFNNLKIDEESMQREFCSKIRNALGINYSDITIMNSMERDSSFLEKNWDILGDIVLPYVFGGIAIEGPSSTIKNSFVIGFFLGALKEKNKYESKNWKFGNKFLKDLNIEL